MSPDRTRRGGDQGLAAGAARVDATLSIRATPDAVCAALADPAWLGPSVDAPPEHPEHRRVETDLAFALPAEARTLTFRKAAFVDIGSVMGDGRTCSAEIGWRASTLAPLFPVFGGRVEARDGVLRLDGVYAPPGGGIGLLVDRALLHFVAQRTAIWFLERVAAQVDAPSSSDRRDG
jgi:hypothetical protein